MVIMELEKAMSALSSEIRLRIINVLLERECCVCEVMQALDISQTRASRNLTELYEAGLLKLRREGLLALYSIDEKDLKPHLRKLIQAVREGMSGSEVATADGKRLKAAKRSMALACQGTPVA